MPSLLSHQDNQDDSALFSRQIAAQLAGPQADSGIIDQLHGEWRSRFADPIEPRPMDPEFDADPERVLRIGYISDRFCESDLMTLLEPELKVRRFPMFVAQNPSKLPFYR